MADQSLTPLAAAGAGRAVDSIEIHNPGRHAEQHSSIRTAGHSGGTARPVNEHRGGRWASPYGGGAGGNTRSVEGRLSNFQPKSGWRALEKLPEPFITARAGLGQAVVTAAAGQDASDIKPGTPIKGQDACRSGYGGNRKRASLFP